MTRTEQNRLARQQARERAEQANEHRCQGDRAGWCTDCLTLDAIAHARRSGRPARSRTRFDPFTVFGGR